MYYTNRVELTIQQSKEKVDIKYYFRLEYSYMVMSLCTLSHSHICTFQLCLYLQTHLQAVPVQDQV